MVTKPAEFIWTVTISSQFQPQLFADTVGWDYIGNWISIKYNLLLIYGSSKKSLCCHLLADTHLGPSKGLQTHTSESSFLFFSSFFSFSSSWEPLPLCTRRSFSLTWSSALSTWAPQHNNTSHPHTVIIWLADQKRPCLCDAAEKHLQPWISWGRPHGLCPLWSTCWTWPCWSRSSQRTVSTWGQRQMLMKMHIAMKKATSNICAVT